MRKITFTPRSQTASPEQTRARANQVAELLSLWSSLGAAGLTAEAAPQRPLLAEKARFVVSLAQHYQQQSASQEVLLKAAHHALVALINQYAAQPEQLDKVLALVLRNTMVTSSQVLAKQQT